MTKVILSVDDILKTLVLKDSWLGDEDECEDTSEGVEQEFYLRMTLTKSDYLNKERNQNAFLISNKKSTPEFQTSFTFDEIKAIADISSLDSFTAESVAGDFRISVTDLLQKDQDRLREEESDFISDIIAQLAMRESIHKYQKKEEEIEPEEFMSFLDGIFQDAFKDNQ